MTLPADCFSPDGIEQREIEFADGSKVPVWFRRLPNSTFERYAAWIKGTDEVAASLAHARLLAFGVCEADGRDALTVEQADRIKRPVALRILAELLRVNGYERAAAQTIETDSGN
jgi:hypothetical protein